MRGFVNDGSVDYKTHPAVDSLAFGHCDFSYRNLGRPSTIQIRQDTHYFEVIIDHMQCFFTDKVCSAPRNPRVISTEILAGQTPFGLHIWYIGCDSGDSRFIRSF